MVAAFRINRVDVTKRERQVDREGDQGKPAAAADMLSKYTHPNWLGILTAYDGPTLLHRAARFNAAMLHSRSSHRIATAS